MYIYIYIYDAEHDYTVYMHASEQLKVGLHIFDIETWPSENLQGKIAPLS